MIRSMTGYGKSESTLQGLPCSVEIRCVNARYLELTTRLPKHLATKELLVRETVREHVSRGTISVYVRLEAALANEEVSFNTEAAERITKALRQLRDKLHLEGDVTLEALMKFDAVMARPDEDAERPDAWPELKESIVEALRSLNTMREKEGAELTADFDNRIAAIDTALADIEVRSAQRIPLERVRLRERVRQLMEDSPIDDQRLQLEIVLLSEKLDVSEECVRLRSHMKFFREYMNEETAVGRKLNFLMQEMNREVNTIGSKANDPEIARLVVGMKEELERMREQVQNVE